MTETKTKLTELVKDELSARDQLKEKIENIESSTIRNQGTLDTEVRGRSELEKTLQALVEDGKDATAVGEQITTKERICATCSETIARNAESIAARKADLRTAEQKLKRAALSALQELRPDVAVSKLFDAAMDAVDSWRKTYTAILTDLGSREHIDSTDSEWWLALDVHLPDPTVKRLIDFVPKEPQPEPMQSTTGPAPPVKPESASPPVEHAPGKDMTPSVQADARKNARIAILRGKGKRQTVADIPGVNVQSEDV